MADEKLGKQYREASRMANIVEQATRTEQKTRSTTALIIGLLVFIVFCGGYAYMAGWF